MKKFNIVAKGICYTPEISIFAGGEVKVLVPEIKDKPDVCYIDAMLTAPSDILVLVMLVDAIREQGVKSIRLSMPYIPYARQDRVCNKGEAFSLRAFAKIINSLEFASIKVYDPHSEVATRLIERCIVVEQASLLAQHKGFTRWLEAETLLNTPLYLLSPDAGAAKKIERVASVFPEFKGIIHVNKHREPKTGVVRIVSVTGIPDDLAEAKVLVCDDICDGGRTFLELANWFTDTHFRSAPLEMNLFVTHGIFSRGREVFGGLYKNVWCVTDFNTFKD